MTANEDRLQVSFPASETFTRIGRVAIAGLALRLGLDISVVESLRSAVDTAVISLHGPGRVQVQATWASKELVVVLTNPAVVIDNQGDLASQLASLVNRVSIDSTTISLAVSAPAL